MNQLKQTTGFGAPDDWFSFVDYVSHTSRFFLTDYWRNFLDILMDTAEKRRFVLRPGAILFRARIGISLEEDENGTEDYGPISPKKMGAPPNHLATEGRLNSEGIPILYLANDCETAIAEVRPWIGAEVSLGRFRIGKKLVIADASRDQPVFFPDLIGDLLLGYQQRDSSTYSYEEKEEVVWGDINSAISKPISSHETHLTYLPTQYLAEMLKLNGWDGVKYSSSLNPKGYNLALFDPSDAVCFASYPVQMKAVRYKWEQTGNPISQEL